MHRAAKIKPVVIDESLVDLESLLLEPRDGLLGRGIEDLQRAQWRVVDGGGRAEISACSSACRT